MVFKLFLSKAHFALHNIFTAHWDLFYFLYQIRVKNKIAITIFFYCYYIDQKTVTHLVNTRGTQFENHCSIGLGFDVISNICLDRGLFCFTILHLCKRRHLSKEGHNSELWINCDLWEITFFCYIFITFITLKR